MAIMISIPPGIVANQEAAQSLTENFNNTISNMQAEINKTATMIECQATSGGGMPSGAPPSMPSFGFGRAESFINETVADEIGSIDGVKDVVPFLATSSEETTSETINTPRGTFAISRPLYTITGVPLNSSFLDEYSVLPTNIMAGGPLHEGDSGVLLMSSNLSDYFGASFGGKIEIYGVSFTIVGIYEPASEGRTQTREVYMNISDAQTITSNTGNVSRIDVYADDVSNVDQIAEVIKTAYSELSVTTYEDRLTQLTTMETRYNETLTNAESTLSQTQTVATQEIIVAVAATSLIVLFVMLYTVRERTKEIGTLKAIGFSNWNVMGQFMLEGMLLSAIAGVVGIAIGSIAAPMLSSLLLPHINLFGGSSQGRFQPTFGSTDFGQTASAVASATPNLQLMLLALGAAVLLGVLGSLYPAWRAAKIKPAEAMRYE